MITPAEIQMIRNADPDAILPGIDTITGNPYDTSTLLDVTKITQNSKAPYYYSPSHYPSPLQIITFLIRRPTQLESTRAS
jgi:hypothetical protein